MNDRRVVVVIDRDEEVRSVLRTTLGEAGFEVHCAATGEAGVALVRAMQPDTVTLDLVLPDMHGYEVLRRIREFSHTYILIITARSDLGRP
jgi:two-component system OmpR family response regulator